ncbi:unnamed protein product [Choristocarpus tenellus]
MSMHARGTLKTSCFVRISPNAEVTLDTSEDEGAWWKRGWRDHMCKPEAAVAGVWSSRRTVWSSPHYSVERGFEYSIFFATSTRLHRRNCKHLPVAVMECKVGTRGVEMEHSLCYGCENIQDIVQPPHPTI